MKWNAFIAGLCLTAAAVAAGIRDFRKDVRIAGVVLNRVASPRHEDLIRRGMKFVMLGRIDIEYVARWRIGVAGKHREGWNQAEHPERLLQNAGDLSVA